MKSTGASGSRSSPPIDVAGKSVSMGGKPSL
jgi:hypothetical protein